MLKQYDTFNIIYEKKCDDEFCNKERIAITFHYVKIYSKSNTLYQS